jgi:hypothetical protein
MHAHHQNLLIGMRTLRVIDSPKRVSATKCAMRLARQEQASIARKRKKKKYRISDNFKEV